MRTAYSTLMYCKTTARNQASSNIDARLSKASPSSRGTPSKRSHWVASSVMSRAAQTPLRLHLGWFCISKRSRLPMWWGALNPPLESSNSMPSTQWIHPLYSMKVWEGLSSSQRMLACLVVALTPMDSMPRSWARCEISSSTSRTTNSTLSRRFKSMRRSYYNLRVPHHRWCYQGTITAISNRPITICHDSTPSRGVEAGSSFRAAEKRHNVDYT